MNVLILSEMNALKTDIAFIVIAVIINITATAMLLFGVITEMVTGKSTDLTRKMIHTAEVAFLVIVIVGLVTSVLTWPPLR